MLSKRWKDNEARQQWSIKLICNMPTGCNLAEKMQVATLLAVIAEAKNVAVAVVTVKCCRRTFSHPTQNYTNVILDMEGQ